MDPLNYVLGISGLQNIGNTCYMNSIIQALASIDVFRSYLITNKFVPRLFQKLSDKNNNQLTDQYVKEIQNHTVFQLATLFKMMWNQNRTCPPHDFKMHISNKHKMFMGFKQHDSQEFLNILLDTIHEELKISTDIEYNITDEALDEFIAVKSELIDKENKKILQKDEEEKYNTYIRKVKDSRFDIYINGSSYVYWGNYIKSSYSIITHLFAGLFLNIVICQNENCRNISESFDPFTMLSVELDGNKQVTLEECLQKFTEGEYLKGDEKYYCTECKQYVDAIRTIKIWKIPQVLIIQLKRFETTPHGGMKKIRSKVEVPVHNLDVTPFMATQTVSDNVYQLQAISNHMGSCHGGHYVSYCRNSLNDEWYEFNDESVQHFPAEDIGDTIVSDEPYILFYVRDN